MRTPFTSGSTRSRASRPRLALWLAVLLVLGAFCLGGSYALWQDSATFTGFTLRAGDLDLVRDGDVTWTQVTPGVASPASGTLGTTPQDFRSMPGDVIRIAYPFRIVSDDDNLASSISVTTAGNPTPAPANEVHTTFHVETAAGHQVAPATGEAAFGEDVGLPGSGSQRLVLVVTVEVGGDYRWSAAPQSDFLATWDAGTFSVSLTQHRADAQPAAPSPAPAGSGAGA